MDDPLAAPRPFRENEHPSVTAPPVTVPVVGGTLRTWGFFTAGSTNVQPFQVELRLNGSSWEARVLSDNSTLMGVGLNPSNLIAISGFDSWEPVNNGDVAYLEWDVFNDTWEVKIGAPWDEEYPPYTFDESDPPEVEFVYKLIAKFVETDSGLSVIQCVTTGLRLETRHDNGTYLDYPVADSVGIEP